MAEFTRATRRQRHNVVRKMNRICRCLSVPQPTQSLRDHILQIRLPCINHVVNARCRLTKMRRSRIIRIRCRGPNGLARGCIQPPLVIEILPQQPEFPELVGNIFPDVRHRPIRSHNNLVLRVFLFFILIRALGVLCGESFFLRRYDPTARPLPGCRQLNCTSCLQFRKGGVPELQV